MSSEGRWVVEKDILSLVISFRRKTQNINTMKTLFIDRMDGQICLCPFLGYPVNNIDEMKKVIKTFFIPKKGYPGLLFSTNNPDIKVLFAGHQYQHGETGRWTIYSLGSKYSELKWSHLTEELFSLLCDTKKVDEFVTKIKERI